MFLGVIEDWPFGSQGLKQSPLPETISMKPTQKTGVRQVKLCQRECRQIQTLKSMFLALSCLLAICEHAGTIR
jgi:hypothetical protein